MGCKQSTPVVKAPRVEKIPTSQDLTRPFDPQTDLLPLFSTGNKDNDLTSTTEQSQFLVQKTNKSAKGDAYRVKDMAKNENGGHDDWLGEQGIFVEPVPIPGLVRRNMESWTGLYRGKEASPLGYWICDPSRGVNTFFILKETPNYKGQTFETRQGQDQGMDTIYATPFKGRTSVNLYHYARIEFDLKTTLVNIRVLGAPKCHGPDDNETPFRMRQADASTWILYGWDYISKNYNACALFVQIQHAGILKFPQYQVTIAPGLDPAFVTLLLTVTDYFWEYRLKKAGMKLY